MFNGWRAPLNNDCEYVEAWEEVGLNKLTSKVIFTRYNIVNSRMIEVEVKNNMITPDGTIAFQTTFIYTFYGDGEIRIEQQVIPAEHLPILPRVGIQMEIENEFNNFKWYGRGPYETYPDRKYGAKIGIYSDLVDEQFVPYVVPQEAGNKTDVRWATLTNNEGCGLFITGEDLLNVNALYYTSDDITGAKHTYDLIKRNEIILSVDHRMAGIGNGSLRAETLQQYRVFPEKYNYTLTLKPL